MSKHVLDRNRKVEGGRAERFAEIERQQGPDGSSEAAKTLIRRPRDRKESTRAEKFTRIERGEGEV